MDVLDERGHISIISFILSLFVTFQSVNYYLYLVSTITRIWIRLCNSFTPRSVWHKNIKKKYPQYRNKKITAMQGLI